MVASSGRVKQVRLHPPRWEIMFNLVAGDPMRVVSVMPQGGSSWAVM